MLGFIRKRNMLALQHRFLFILSPPYCGSTLLSRILGTSKRVSVNNEVGTREGQTLPCVRDVMFVDRRWDESYIIDWDFVKQAWLKHWDLQKPVLLDKSPPNILRAGEIEQVFRPASFFVLVRNPYAHCESLIRRNRDLPEQAAGFAIRCLNWQRRNMHQLANVRLVKYESLTENPQKFAANATEFVTDLGHLTTDGVFEVHNYQDQHLQITNLNHQNISRLKPREIERINSVFSRHIELLDWFAYRLLENDWQTAARPF